VPELSRKFCEGVALTNEMSIEDANRMERTAVAFAMDATALAKSKPERAGRRFVCGGCLQRRV
jgi:hypothetical protein